MATRLLFRPSGGDIVVMDNLPVHKVAGVREAIEAAGATRRAHACASAPGVKRTFGPMSISLLPT